MNRSASQNPEGEHPLGKESSSYQELREQLVGPEQQQISEILERLNDPVLRAEELSQALPDAITIGVSSDDRIARALQPTIDTALKVSAQKNPKAIADAIFPIFGPAIRKAISAALTGMIQSFNHMLNQSLSWQGFKWRIEALRTQKSFAELVLLHTLVYRVEQIFLIHCQSGLLLQHAVADNIDSKDPDLVSGMLTAIQDFVKESFDAKTGEMLDTLRMSGDHSVWIEQGPEVVLAAVIRGIPPVDLRSRFRDLLDHVHQMYGNTLENFDGRTSSFAMIKPDLEEALTFQVKPQKKSVSPVLWLLVLAGLFFGSWWGWNLYDSHRHWNDLVARLRAEKGIMLTTYQKVDGHYYLAGFRDPLARNVDELVTRSGMDPIRIQSRWQPFYSLDEAIVNERARQIFQPPPAVQLELSNGILAARGEAPHQWVKRFRSQAVTIPGILGYDDTRLVDSEMRELREEISSLERKSILFELGKARLNQSQSKALAAIRESLERIQSLKAALGIGVSVAILGQSDPTGSWSYNLELSQRRAWSVLSYLLRNNIDPADLHTGGTAVQTTESETRSAEELQAFRSVVFKASIRTD